MTDTYDLITARITSWLTRHPLERRGAPRDLAPKLTEQVREAVKNSDLVLIPAQTFGELRDRQAAFYTNAAFAAVNAEPPGTLSTAATVHISPETPCGCSCSAVCTQCPPPAVDGAA